MLLSSCARNGWAKWQLLSDPIYGLGDEMTPQGVLRAGLTGLSSTVGVYFRKYPVAEEVGFEPTEGFPSHDFQSCRFGRSRTPPQYRHALFEMDTGSQGYPSRFEDRSGSLFNAEVHRSGRVPCDDRL